MGRNWTNNALDSAGGYLCPVKIGVGCARTSLLSRERVGSIVVAIVILVWLSSDDSSTDPIPMRFAHGETGVMTLRISFSPDGKTIATVDSAGASGARDNEDDWRINRFLDFVGDAWSVAFSPDGRFLAVGGAEPDILVFDLPFGDSPRVLETPTGKTKALAFSPDGSTLAATTAQNGEINLYDLVAGRAWRPYLVTSCCLYRVCS